MFVLICLLMKFDCLFYYHVLYGIYPEYTFNLISLAGQKYQCTVAGCDRNKIKQYVSPVLFHDYHDLNFVVASNKCFSIFCAGESSTIPLRSYTCPLHPAEQKCIYFSSWPRSLKMHCIYPGRKDQHCRVSGLA